ncbi:phage portal protein [Herminiimonas sp. CN]|uniref:phage portal protein n=1 Tax=Herminiimonas sp. CN TaxID=1349818 RepID=UPI0004742AB3|nr:phage portal protein [Herminiimonas sp. CN]
MLKKIRTWAAGVIAPQNNAGGWINGDSQTYQDISWWAPSFAGQIVTKETAMRVSAVYACVRLIAGSIASLPLPVYERTTLGRKHIEDHPLFWVLNEEPTPRYTASTMWEYIVKCVLLRGDGFAIIVRDRAGRVTELIPVDTDNVIVERSGNRNAYYVQMGDKRTGYDQDDILHFPGFGFNGIRSMSVIQWAAKQSIGIAMASEEHSARFFSNGMSPSYAIKAPNKMTEEQITRLRQQVAEKAGGTANAHKPLVLTEGLDIANVAMSAVDGQLLESRKFQIIDIARAFGVPPHMIGATEVSSSWGTGIEQMTLGYVKFTLSPYLTRWEQEINRKIFRTARNFVSFDLSGLLRGDDKARADYLRQAIGGSQGPGWMTKNEARHQEYMLPIDGGDELYDPTKGNVNANNAKTPATGN